MFAHPRNLGNFYWSEQVNWFNKQNAHAKRRGLLTYRLLVAFLGAWGVGKDLVHAFFVDYPWAIGGTN